LLGAAEAGFFPGVLFYLSQWAPASRRARFTALFMSAMALSGIIGGPLAGLIMHSMDGFAGLKGWQWLFIVEGAPACVLGLVCYALLADRPADAHWLSAQDKRIIETELQQEGGSKGVHRHSSFSAALRDKRLYALAAMSSALISGIGAVALWLPTIMRNAGMTDVLQIGTLAAVPYIFAVIVQQLVARSSDRRGERRWHAAIPAAIAALAWFGLPLVQDQRWLSLGLLTVIASGSFGATGPFWSLPASYLTGAAAAGGIAIVTTCGGIFGFLSPILVGWAATATGSLASGYIYYGVLMALGASILIYGTRVRAQLDAEAASP
jgi:MFS family permease